MSLFDPEQKEVLISTLKKRILINRIIAYTSLLLIIFIFATGIFQLINTRLKQDSELITNELGITNDKLSQVGYLIDSFNKRDAIKLREELKETNEDERYSLLIEQGTIRIVNEESSRIDSLINRISLLIDDVESMEEQSELNQIISGGIIRVGIILVVIYLMQIMIRIFQYYIRLAGFYKSRLDSLFLYHGNDIEELQKLTMIFSPDKIDLGKYSKGPVESGIDITKEYLKR